MGDRKDGDLVVVSIHWGSNRGYHVPGEQVALAHRLIHTGVDLAHEHSSHHPRPIADLPGQALRLR